ncbi:uncharacterized protein HRG_02015 [Hirsutella rhossiliensis]|uniref:Uncharacterized protein n=1 Tax=Hirsutella rhossiliensis TaxID=111463 RepID=A0A9P8SMY0_9HYPO|nr:uncharacterized protein HRG_02015 [Hirsutella rhossiliensis]KAH0966606.1 hypothetical protein HRG_02015 [Hirsutella rhossiliensis]
MSQGQTEGIRVIQPQEDVRLRQPISAQEFMRGTDFAADFSAIDPQLRFKDISVDNITEIHATTYAAKALKAYTLEKMWDDEVFHAFQQDFEGWTLDMFLMVEISYRRELRRVLRRKGVYTGTNHQRIERSLIKLLEADSFPTWDPEEFTKQIFDVRSNASWQQQALATPSSRENIQNPTQDQSPRDQPTTQAQALQQQQQVVSQGPQRPPEQAQQMTPQGTLFQAPFSQESFPQDIPTQQTQTKSIPKPLLQSFPSRQTQPDGHQPYKALPLYTGEPYDLLDDKMKIFFNICFHAQIRETQFYAVFPRILNGRAETFYLHYVDQDDTFAIAYHKVKTHFDTDVNHHHYYTDWTTATFELFDPTKHRGTRIFKSRLVREVKGKYIKPYEKSRLVVQGYNDDEKNTL